MKIKAIRAREILDSRATPTVECEITLEDGRAYSASVPAGASKGQHEALELRDGDPRRYGGKGTLAAVNAVNSIIAPTLIGHEITDLTGIDRTMIALDGTRNKSNLGANSILSVSFAAARAASGSVGVPLYALVGGAYADRMPIPMMNILNGGAHATNNIDIQEFMIIPCGADSLAEAVRMGAEVYHTLRSLLIKHGYSTGVGDEGGFAPTLASEAKALSIICEAIEKAGYRAGTDIALGLDVAASEWYSDGVYTLPKRGERMNSEQLCDYILSLVRDYPIISVEDGAADVDLDGWVTLGRKLGDTGCLLVGDDLFVTDADRVAEGALRGIASAVLVKPNQIGTVTEAYAAIRTASHFGYKSIMSHRSGETEDTVIADLAVGFATHYIKTGAPSRSERVAKYNRLMRIESSLFSPKYGF
ncbi:MAG: phosphopyruvate hydratase [Clostridia bacterium]|nr:phosphopyruvate hydratase [Clostridia bacterium]